MEQLPLFIYVLFAFTVFITLILFYAANGSKTAIIIVTGWAILQSTLGLSGIYLDTNVLPPRIILFGLMPALICMLFILLSKKGNIWLVQFNLRKLTFFHAIRIPVEICLSYLYHYKVMSVYITFEGTNFDILSGISALMVGIFAFRSGKINHKLALIWNIAGTLLLLNVVITAILAFPSPFQKLAFEQPNVAVLYFPFNLLPTVIVPLVLFAHLLAIRRLVKPQSTAVMESL